MAAIVFGQQTARPAIERRLTTGQTIGLTSADEKMLRSAYDYMQGFHKREKLENYIEQKRVELLDLASKLPINNAPRPSHSPTRMNMLAPSLQTNNRNIDSSENDKQLMENYKKLENEMTVLEENLQTVAKADSKISPKDLEALLKSLGVNVQKRVLEHMMYEVDEAVDDVICWDEFQLTYYRNITDTTGSEPCSFFRIMEFVMFDPPHKGLIMEDDVMEILFVRIGAGRLEQEIKSVFGKNLRASGGTGTLNLESYLNSCLRKTGRRALVT
jgi:Ca2+-binding EF-hand superfamily protein